MLSVAAAIPTAQIERHLADGVPVVRAMPNAPVDRARGHGRHLRGRARRATSTSRSRRRAARARRPRRRRCPSTSMDAITAVSGSGPAYFALLAEAMIEAGILLGLSREVSTTARRADDARHREAAPRRGDAPGRAARGGHVAGRDDDPRDPRARAGRRPRRVPERDPGRDGALARSSPEGDELSRLSTSSTTARGAAVAAELLAAAARRGEHDRPHRAARRRRRLRAGRRARAGLERASALVGRRALRAAGRRALELPAGQAHAARPARAQPPEVHRIRGELGRRGGRGRVRRGSKACASTSLLGLGPDGHVGVALPGLAALDERERRVTSGSRPRAVVDRVTMTLPVLSAPRRSSSSSPAKRRRRP